VIELFILLTLHVKSEWSILHSGIETPENFGGIVKER